MIFVLLLCHFISYHWHRCKRRKNEKGYIGIIEKKTSIGMSVKTYDLKKTLCDIINNKDCIDLETRNKSIKKIFQRDDFDIDKMYKYAKTMKIYDKVSNYVEVLL